MAKTKRHYMRQNAPKGWRFGIGQTAKQEIAEIRKAQHYGLEEQYMRRQHWSQLVEAETERKRAA